MARVLITGAGRGLGLGLARVCAAAGHEVIATVRDPAAAQRLPPTVSVISPVDVALPQGAEVLRRGLAGAPLDTLINNAAVYGPPAQSATDMDLDGFQSVMATNVIGTLRVTQAVLDNLLLSPCPRIAAISSRSGSLQRLEATRVAYRASKAALNKMVQCLALDLAARGVAVAAIAPGWVRTDMGGAGAPLTPEESARGIMAVIDGLTLENTGCFVDYDGSPIPW